LVESKELVKESPDLRIAHLAHLSQYLWKLSRLF
jgi:hypothetical protein